MIRKIRINQNNKLKTKLDVVFDSFVILGAESKAPLCLGGPLEAGHSDRKWETRFAAFTFHARRDLELFEYRPVRYWSKEINGTLTGGRKN